MIVVVTICIYYHLVVILVTAQTVTSHRKTNGMDNTYGSCSTSHPYISHVSNLYFSIPDIRLNHVPRQKFVQI